MSSVLPIIFSQLQSIQGHPIPVDQIKLRRLVCEQFSYIIT
jgi:hypothetical protein